MGLAKDVSSYIESSLSSKECFSTVVRLKRLRVARQRGGCPYASRKPPRCWEPGTYAGGRGGARLTEFGESVEA